MSDLYQVYYGRRELLDDEYSSDYLSDAEIDGLSPIGRPMSLEDARVYIKDLICFDLESSDMDDETSLGEVLEDFFNGEDGEDNTLDTDLYTIQFDENEARMSVDWGEIYGSDPDVEVYIYKILPYQEDEANHTHLSVKDWDSGHTMAEMILHGEKEALFSALEIFSAEAEELDSSSQRGEIEAKLLYPLERALEAAETEEPMAFSIREEYWEDGPLHREEHMSALFGAICAAKEEVPDLEIAVRILYDDFGSEDPGDLFLFVPKGGDKDVLDLLVNEGIYELQDSGQEIRDYQDVRWIPKVWKDEMMD